MMKTVFLLLLISAGAQAQVASATLAGTVTDESSALVAGAAIVAAHLPPDSPAPP